MRLSDTERRIIVEQALNVFGDTTHVYLFGSRTDDNKRGGDIDLHVKRTDKSNLFQKEVRLHTQLQLLLGEQEIDIVVTTDNTRMIEKVARNTGIKL